MKAKTAKPKYWYFKKDKTQKRVIFQHEVGVIRMRIKKLMVDAERMHLRISNDANRHLDDLTISAAKSAYMLKRLVNLASLVAEEINLPDEDEIPF